MAHPGGESSSPHDAIPHELADWDAELTRATEDLGDQAMSLDRPPIGDEFRSAAEHSPL